MVHILTKETSSGLMPTTFSYKAAVKCATTANGTLATAYAAGQVVDGYTLIAGDRILIKDQSTASQNGVYTVNATGAPTRATDMNAATMFPGAVVAVQEGTTNADSGWVCTADAGIVLETSDIVWALFGGLKAGLNLAITADVITVTALNMATVTGLAVSGTPIFSMGNLDTAYASTKVANFIPVQVSISQGADIGSGNTVGAAYFRTATGIAQTGQLATVMVRTALGHNVFDAYGMQSHLSITADMATVNDNAHLTAISGKVTMTSGKTVAKGWVTAILGIWEGDGTITQMGHICSLVNEAGSTGCQSLLHLNDDVGTVPYFSFVGADGDGKGLYTGAVPDTLEGSIKCLINNVAHYIPVYANQHA